MLTRSLIERHDGYNAWIADLRDAPDNMRSLLIHE
jgi:hypothetical protein